jgi:hypothetical protein
LQQHAHLVEFLDLVEVLVEVDVAFGVGQYGLVVLRLHQEDGLVKLHGRVDVGSFEQNVAVAEGKQGLFAAQFFHEPLVEVVLGGGFEFNVPALLVDGLLYLDQFLVDDGRRILVKVAHDVGRGRQLAVAHVDQFPDQREGLFHVLGPVVNARQDVRMHVGYQRNRFQVGIFFLVILLKKEII